MKTRISCCSVLLLSLLFSVQLSFAQSEMISGELLHHIEDYDNGVSKDIFAIKDVKTKKVRELKIKGKIPEKLLSAPSGSKIKLKGKKAADHIEAQLLNDDGSISPELDIVTYPAGALKGLREVLVVRVNFTDQIAVCTDEATTFKHILDVNNPVSTKNYYRTNSQGMYDITGEVVSVKLDISVASQTTCDNWNWEKLANEKLAAAGISVTNYQNKVYMLPANVPCGWAGVAWLGSINPTSYTYQAAHVKSCNQKTIAHELGHNYGMHHSGDHNNGYTYGDYSDAMGGQYREFNAPHKEQMGWIGLEKIQAISSAGTYRIAPLNGDSSQVDYPQMLKIKNPASTSEYYYLSYRDLSGVFDQGLMSTYANRLNITRGTGTQGVQTWFMTALGEAGSYHFSSADKTVKFISRTADYIEVQITSGDSVPSDVTPPVVSLSSPASGSKYNEGATVSASASASDNVAVMKVEFYAGGVLKCTDTSSPYSCSFPIPTGTNIAVQAKAIDTSGNQGSSAISYISSVIVDSMAPSVSLTSPSSGSSFNEGSSVSATASASDNIGVARVEFYVGGVRKCSDLSSPYSCIFVMPAGPNIPVLARAFDAAGNSKDSASALINGIAVVDTTPPSIPQGVALSIKRKSDIVVSFNASTDNIKMSHYEILRNGLVIASRVLSPSYTDARVADGTYAYQVRAVDAKGNKSAISEAANIQIGRSSTGTGEKPSPGKGKNK